MPQIIQALKTAHSEHKDLMEVLDQLKGKVGTGVSRVKIEDALQDLQSRTAYHFAAEENLMVKLSYPDADKHRELHTALLHSLSIFKVRLDGEEFVGITSEMIEYLEKWLLNHILTADFEMAKYCQAHHPS